MLQEALADFYVAARSAAVSSGLTPVYILHHVVEADAIETQIIHGFGRGDVALTGGHYHPVVYVMQQHMVRWEARERAGGKAQASGGDGKADAKAEVSQADVEVRQWHKCTSKWHSY